MSDASLKIENVTTILTAMENNTHSYGIPGCSGSSQRGSRRGTLRRAPLLQNCQIRDD